MLMFLTFDFLRCVSVNDLSQFSIQDLRRKLVVPLEHAKQRVLSHRPETASPQQAPFAREMLNFWHTHQVHLGFLQLHLLLPQFLAMKQFHTEVLTQSWRIGNRYPISLTYFIRGNTFFNSFREMKKFYLLVNLLAVWMKAQSPQKQMSGAFRWISILHFTLGCQNPKGWIEVCSYLFNLRIQCELQDVQKQCCALPGLSGCIASIEENTLLIWLLVAWWGEENNIVSMIRHGM